MSTTDESPTKKRRISRACETCRKRKSKCDGGQPVCSICLSNKRICSYDHQGRKRGLQSGYVRSMETILGILVQDLPEVENKIRILLRSAEIGDKIVTPLSAETVTTAWHSSSLHDDVKVLLDHAEDGVQAATDYLPTIETFDSGSATVSSCQTSESNPAHVSSTHPIFDDDTTDNTLDNASELIELYFSHIHHMFPMIERRDILYILHAIQDYATMTSTDKGHLTCLLSMLALTLVYVQQAPETNIQVRQLLKRVDLEINNADQCFGIGHIQAVLLQSLLKVHLGQYDASWICLGQASRQIAVYTERHDSTTNRVAHVIQTCNILDTFVSTIRRRPSHAFFHSYPHLTVDENGLEEWEEWQISTALSEVLVTETRLPVHALSVFCNIAYIMSRLQVLSLKTFSLRSCKSELEHLQSWWKNLPGYCNPSEIAMTPPSVTHLQLFFHFAIITVSVKSGNSTAAVHALRDSARATLNLIQRHVDMKRLDFAFLEPFALHCINCLNITGLALEDSGIRDIEFKLRDLHSTLRPSLLSSFVECERPVSQLALTEGQCIQSPLHTISPQGTAPAIDPSNPQGASCDQSDTLQPKDSVSTDASSNVPAKLALLEFQGCPTNDGVNYEVSISDANVIENEFDSLLDTEMEAFLDANFSPIGDFESTCHNEFVQNLGFLEGSMDSEFLALINHDFGST